MQPLTSTAMGVRFDAIVPRERFRCDLQTPLPRETVLLAAGIKCGSTWMQQILHGLRSGGDMDFDYINFAVPVLEIARELKMDLHAEQKFPPPIFKASSPFEGCPHAEKVIVVTRNPDDAALSLYYYIVDYLFTREELNLDEFVKLFITEYKEDNHPSLNANQMKHMVSWYPHRNEENVLWLHYEDLKADLKQCIKLISDFTGIGVGNQELLDLVEHQSSLEFMRQHSSKFEDRRRRMKFMGTGPLPKLDRNNFNIGRLVRKGAVKESKKAFSSETKQASKQKWMEMLKPVTGYDSYEEMRAAVNAELGRSFPA